MDILQYQSLNTYCEQSQVTLVAVSKYQSIQAIQSLYDLGHRDFGENYVQEVVHKSTILPKDIRWHFIGHLQSNKVKYITPFIHCIQSVDSVKLLQAIHRSTVSHHNVIDVLLQLKLSKEVTKTGLDKLALLDLVSHYVNASETYSHIRIRGLMAMTSLATRASQIVEEFNYFMDTFYHIKASYFKDNPLFTVRSLGMSNDYAVAIKAGSNLIRVGSLIFGERQ